jgi:hypothetical protein
MILWLVVLGRVILLVPLVGFGRVYPGVGNFAKWTQTLALLEVVHSAVGMFLCYQVAYAFTSQLTRANCRHRKSTYRHHVDAGF